MNNEHQFLINILLEHNIFPIINLEKKVLKEKNISYLGTILSNLAYYGFAPNKEVLQYLQELDSSQLIELWKTLESSLKEITGSNVNMQQFMVYKNFPQSVLDMEQSQYWINQIKIYAGYSLNEVFEEKDLEREKINLKSLKLKTLSAQKSESFENIYSSLLQKQNSFTEKEKLFSLYLLEKMKSPAIDVSQVKFKENAIFLAGNLIKKNLGTVNVKDATDVLRISHFLSGGDGKLKEKVKFISFNRSQRKYLLSLLENSKNLQEDVANKSEIFKKFLHNLHPGDFKKDFPKVYEINNLLYNNKLKSFKSLIDFGFKNKHQDVFKLLKSRPGEFLRMWHETYKIFGKQSIDEFLTIADNLTNFQLIKLQKYIETINYRENLLIAPKGNWTKLKTIENKKTLSIKDEDIIYFVNGIKSVLNNKLSKQFEKGVSLDENLKKLKLPTNDQELASYGRGTIFDMQENTTFVRSASYWETPDIYGTTWFDNGWNFFDSNWTALGTICWNSQYNGSLFSGDPINNNSQGAGCQVIDLDLDKLKENGVKYAVWNILAYSNVTFENAKTVKGLLQFGENSLQGEIFEPSRVHLSFDLKGNNLTKYVCIVDVEKKQIIYMDGNLKCNVSSAKSNQSTLEKIMPDFMEYLQTIPNAYELFENAPQGDFIMSYDDKNIKIDDNKDAFVFIQSNKNNMFNNISINNILSGDYISKENQIEQKEIIKPQLN